MTRSDQARLFGVLGDPVDHSLSPAMHNAAFAAARLPHAYLRYRVAPPDLRAALRDARTLRMGGLNLTVPLKEAVLPLLDRVTPEAERIGAVNTIVFGPNGTVGDNTDARGFVRALGHRVRLAGARVVVIGAGGAARAVGSALATAGAAEVVVANRTARRAEALAERLAALGPRTTAVPLGALRRTAALDGATLVVNTTPLGLAGTGVPVSFGATPRHCLFADIVYTARPTPFLAGAARAGRPTIDGAGMLLEQGALAFETWLGRRAPRAAMAAALRAAGLAVTPVSTRSPRRR